MRGRIVVMGGSIRLICLLPVLAQAQPVVINEIHYDPEEKTQPLEFIELHNPGPATLDLTGYRFSSGVEFTFASGSTIPSGGYVVVAEDPVFLNATYGVTAHGPWVGQLSNEGETLRLRDASGDLVDKVDYRAEFPWPIGSSGEGASMELLNPWLDNDLAGSWRASTLEVPAPGTNLTTILPMQSTAWRYRKGTSEASSPTSAWRQLSFVEDGTWLTGQTSIGYGDGDDNTVLTDMQNNYWSVFLRHTFIIPDAGSMPTTLRIRSYADDGCILWINGAEMARPYVPAGNHAYNYNGTLSHNAAWEHIDIPVTGGMLNVGSNVLAVQVFNTTFGSSDLSIDAELLGVDVVTGTFDVSPGFKNRQWTSNAPPQIRQVAHTPKQPRPADPIILTAKVTDPEGVASVSAMVQDVSPGSYLPAYLSLDHATLLANPEMDLPVNPAYTNAANWTTVTMLDDGAGDDAIAGDGVYTATLAARNENRHLVRYKISARDMPGAVVTVPTADDPSLNLACFVYEGVPPYTASIASVHPEGAGHVYGTNLLTSLPVYHLITLVEDYDDCVAYDSALTIGKTHPARSAFNWPGTFVYDGVVYDNMRYRLRQANDRYSGTGRRSFRYRFNRGRYLEARDHHGAKYPEKWRTMNTSKMHRFGSAHNFGLQEHLNFQLWRLAGVPAPFSHYAHMRLVRGTNELDQYYGDFQGLTMAVEDYDSRFLNAHDLQDGNVYKLKDGFTNGDDLKRNQGRDSVVTDSDYDNIFLNLFPERDETWLNSHVRWDKWYAYHAICEAVRHPDFHPYYTGNTSWHKNRVWYFEPRTNTPLGLLWVLPHDTDASWSRGYHDERLGPGKPNNSVGLDYPKLAIFGYLGSGYVNTSTRVEYRREFRNVIRDLRDLLFTETVISNLLTDSADVIRDFSLADRDRWKNAPPAVGYENDIAIETREQQMWDFAFYSELWYGTNVPGGRAACLDVLAAAEGDGTSIPDTPSIVYCGLTNYPVNGICFSTGPFQDPQGNGTFDAMEWRIGEVTDTNAPAHDPFDARHYEYKAVWKSGLLSNYSSSISVPAGTLKVGHAYRARVRLRDDTGRWSHWSPAHSFIPGEGDGYAALLTDLRISEVMYHSMTDDSLDFIELHNTSTNVTLDLGGVTFTKGVTFTFTNGTTLNPGGVLLVVGEAAWTSLPTFRAYYGLSPALSIHGPYQGGLSNGGEELRLKTALGGAEVVSLSYTDDDPWPKRADGQGSSLEIVDFQGPGSDPLNWRASEQMDGTPGWIPVPGSGTVLINEVLAHTDPPLVDSIELYNSGASAVDIGGWYLSDATDYRKFKFPANTVIAPFSYLVADETDFNPNGDWNTDPGKGPVDTNLHFALNSYDGDDVYLVEANAFDQLVRFSDSVHFGATANGESLGRWPDGAGPLYPMFNRTLGSVNTGPRVGPVVISEIMYHPADTNNANGLEFIEILNTGSAIESLDNWTLDGAVDYEFATGTQLAPGSNLVIVGFSPLDVSALAIFQSAYGSVNPVGPWSGQLNNAGETMKLRRADDPPLEDPSLYPQVEEERVRYDELPPWPAAADGLGSSLQRQNPLTFGDIAANWVALAPTVGTHPASPAFEVWRAGYFTPAELNDLGISGADKDPDGDGITTGDEFIADTDPRDPASYLWLGIQLGGANQRLISFSSSGERAYSLEQALPVLGAGWTPILSDQPGNGGMIEWVVPSVEQKGYYRLEVDLP